ncbi:putative solute carrier family 35 member G1-like [Apostichopus japonicus]|uniref:Putative solute carrier family 35 member G1-like n=1 Tax=Stichopus japonicus TaxID=307972 RepID=A0A2G8JQ90_STIJA|nr:putative solute carrier family 35 member G1-like [Apostichopus japonicus]
MNQRKGFIRCLDTVARAIYNNRGIFLAVATSCMSAFVTVIVSILHGSVHSTQLTFIRGVFSYVLSLTFLIYKKIPIKSSSREEFKVCTVYGILSVTSIFGQYYAVQNMPPGDAAAILYGYIAFSVVFGRLLLKEKFGWIEALMVVSTITGVILIMRPSFLFGSDGSGKSTKLLPGLCVLYSSVASGFITVALRSLGQQNTHPMKSVNFYAAFLVVFGAIPVTIKQEWNLPDCVINRLLIVSFGFTTFMLMVTFTCALVTESIAVVTVITVSEVWIVFFIDIMVLDTTANIWSIFGIALIVGSSVGISVKRIYEGRMNSAEVIRKDDAQLEEKTEKTSSTKNCDNYHVIIGLRETRV